MSGLSYQTRRSVANINREMAKHERREFWKAVRALDDVDEGTEEYGLRRLELQMQVSMWLLGAPFTEKQADEYEILGALWYDVDLAGHATGLKEAADRLKYADPAEQRAPVDFLLATGRALNNAAIVSRDLHPLPPVEVADE